MWSARASDTRSHQMPDFGSVLEGSDIGVKLYGRALTLSLREDNHRVYIARFTIASFATDREALEAFMKLWRGPLKTTEATGISKTRRDR